MAGITLSSRAAAILSRLPENVPLIGAEVGVWKGSLSQELLRCLPLLTLYMVDMWSHDPNSQSIRVAKHGQRFWNTIHNIACINVQFAGERARIVRADSVDASRHVPMLDFAFIDDDHSYRGCTRSLYAWFTKIKQGGWIGGHDYNWREVHLAVTDFFLPSGLTIRHGQDRTWFVQVPE